MKLEFFRKENLKFNAEKDCLQRKIESYEYVISRYELHHYFQQRKFEEIEKEDSR